MIFTNVGSKNGEDGFNFMVSRIQRNAELLGMLKRKQIEINSDKFKEFLMPYINSRELFYIDVINNLIKNWLDFMPIYFGVGVEVEIIKLESEFPRGLEMVRDAEGRTLVRTNWMTIQASLRVKCLPMEVGHWKIGFIQTVRRLERKVTIVNRWGKRTMIRSFTKGPVKDGPSGYAEVWHDPKCVEPINQEFQVVDIVIKDRPGIVAPLDAAMGQKIEKASGGEEFRTWIAIRRNTGGLTKFIHMWRWHVNYSIEPANMPRLGIAFDGYQPNPDGDGAVLEGPFAKEAIHDEEISSSNDRAGIMQDDDDD